MLAKTTGSLIRAGIWVGLNFPGRCERKLMNISNLRETERCLWFPLTCVQCLTVDPFCGISVALDLHVLAEFFVTYRKTLLQKDLDLLDDQSITLDGSGMMRFLIPDRSPDIFCFNRRGESTHPIIQLGYGLIQPLIN